MKYILFTFSIFILAQPVAAEITNFDECVAAGNPVMRSMPPKCSTKDGLMFTAEDPRKKEKVNKERKSFCKDQCGNNFCEEIVCMAEGCPCPESPTTCPQDCSTAKPDPDFVGASSLEPF